MRERDKKKKHTQNIKKKEKKNIPGFTSQLHPATIALPSSSQLDVLMNNHQANVALFGISMLHQSRANLSRRM